MAATGVHSFAAPVKSRSQLAEEEMGEFIVKLKSLRTTSLKEESLIWELLKD
jgi:hypothetical protein